MADLPPCRVGDKIGALEGTMRAFVGGDVACVTLVTVIERSDDASCGQERRTIAHHIEKGVCRAGAMTSLAADSFLVDHQLRIGHRVATERGVTSDTTARGTAV